MDILLDKRMKRDILLFVSEDIKYRKLLCSTSQLSTHAGLMLEPSLEYRHIPSGKKPANAHRIGYDSRQLRPAQRTIVEKLHDMTI